MTTSTGDMVVVGRDVRGEKLVLSVCQLGVYLAVELEPWEWERVRKSGETEAAAIWKGRLTRHLEGAK